MSNFNFEIRIHQVLIKACFSWTLLPAMVRFRQGPMLPEVFRFFYP
jgi:hypothetical protein